MAITVERVTEFKNADLADLCQATTAAISDGIGFNWVAAPQTEVLEAYWRGVLIVPERVLFIGRLDGTIAASIQLLRPGKNKQASAFSASIEAHFVAPWARGHGLAKALLTEAEKEAKAKDFTVLTLHVRETQEAAIKLYEESGFVRWGILPFYEMVNGKTIAGHYFYKTLKRAL